MNIFTPLWYNSFIFSSLVLFSAIFLTSKIFDFTHFLQHRGILPHFWKLFDFCYYFFISLEYSSIFKNLSNYGHFFLVWKFLCYKNCTFFHLLNILPHFRIFFLQNYCSFWLFFIFRNLLFPKNFSIFQIFFFWDTGRVSLNFIEKIRLSEESQEGRKVDRLIVKDLSWRCVVIEYFFVVCIQSGLLYNRLKHSG